MNRSPRIAACAKRPASPAQCLRLMGYTGVQGPLLHGVLVCILVSAIASVAGSLFLEAV